MKGGRCRDDLTSQPGPPRVGAFFQAEPKAGISGGLAPALFQLSVLILGEDYTVESWTQLCPSQTLLPL